ncbi:MAG: hypothetical protein LIP12_08505 [Clostridiales bacterium]|nr:hypothetical protein [Clostridiales bacterium]
MAGSKKRKGTTNQSQPPPDGKRSGRAAPLNAEHQKMLDWLRTVKFKKTLFGGVKEADVWKKLEELNRLYEASLIAERARYDALLEEQAKSVCVGSGGNQQSAQETVETESTAGQRTNEQWENGPGVSGQWTTGQQINSPQAKSARAVPDGWQIDEPRQNFADSVSEELREV